MAQGAPGALAEQVAETLAQSTHEGDTVSRCVVATERGVLLDELTHRHRAQPVVTFDVLPELANWLADESMLAQLQEVLREQVVARALSELHDLRNRLGQGTRVSTGIPDVVEALVRGQVDRLYLDPAAAAETDLAVTDHPGLALGAVASTGELRADRALIAAACLTDAELVVAHTSRLVGAPAAAVLRWDQGDQA